MIEAIAHHQTRLTKLGFAESLVREMLGDISPTQRLLPHQETHLVAKVKEDLILRIMDSPYKITSEVPEVLKILYQQSQRLDRAKFRM